MYNEYEVKAFLDANIVLEGRPLPELPWEEIHPDGPILALLTPTAIREIDSKKHDGRLAKVARAFNRLISPVATGSPPIVLREAGPRVELTLSSAAHIPWDQYDDLDPADGDSSIVAEVLHARDVPISGKLVVSHDIKPLIFASSYGVATRHVSDNWLRQPEPGPADKENQRLKQRLAQYQATEPAFDISIDLLSEEPVSIVRIEDLSDAERTAIQRRIYELNPPIDQARGAHGLIPSLAQYDPSYDERFQSYRDQLSIFLEIYAQKLEKLFNQVHFAVKVTNVGEVHAENILMEINVANGWSHDRYAFVSPRGPAAPRPRELPYFDTPNLEELISPRAGRHEFEFRKEPDCGPSISVTCEDFRHGQDWTFDGVVGMDARAEQLTTINVLITASNLRGSAEQVRVVERKVEVVHVSKLVDLDSLKLTAPIPMEELIKSREGLDSIHWGAFDEE
jgi:hypothetical protein